MTLNRTAKGWIEPSPEHCPNGHTLDANALVGWQWCVCGGHRTHYCRTCGETTWTPALGQRCEVKNFDGRT